MDPKLKAQMDADLAKPLPGAPPVKRPAPAPKGDPKVIDAAIKRLRALGPTIRKVTNTPEPTE